MTLYRRSPGAYDCSIESDTVVFDSGRGRYYRLNRTAAFLWRRLQDSASRSELVSALRVTFSGATIEECMKETDRFLESMSAYGLVQT